MAIARHLRGAAAAGAVVALLAGALTAALGADAAGAATRTTGTADGRIVYDEGSTGQLFTINPDGTAKVQVTNVPSGQFAVQPAWFPAARRIVFASNPGGGDFRLFVIRRNGTHMRQVVADGPGFGNFTPAVTPDGNSIIYSRCRPDPPGGCALFAVNVDGTGRHALTHFGRGQNAGRQDFWADVSPDGTQVAFNRVESRGIASQVWVTGIDGSDAHPITRPRLEAAVPRWTPDGRHLLVTSNWVHLGEQIYRVCADGSDLDRLTHTRFPFNNGVGVPSPSGDLIAFTSDRAYPQPFAGNDLFVMESDGSAQRSIATGNIFDQDWGTAPLLPDSAATPPAELAPPRPLRQVRAVQHLLPR